MGRKSVLTEEQWVEVGKRLLEGDTPERISADLTAQGSKVSPSSIRDHFARKGQSTKTVQKVAGELYNAELAKESAERHLKDLPPAAQYAAITLAAKMRSISDSLASAADNGAKTALRLTALANTEAAKIEDADPLKSVEQVKSTVLLTKAANEAAHIPLNLLAANRETVKRLNEDEAAGREDVITPERLQEGTRRIAFLLHRAAVAQPEASNG